MKQWWLVSAMTLLTTAAVAKTSVSAMYEQKTATDGGTGKWYMEREIAAPMKHEAEKESSLRYLADSLNIKDDSRIVVMGTGSDVLTLSTAPRVMKGKVYALSTDAAELRKVDKARQDHKFSNIDLRLASATDTRLDPNSIDTIVLVDVYHQFSPPQEIMSSFTKALKSRGRLYVVEYRVDEKNAGLKGPYKMTEEQIKKEIEAAGLRFAEIKHVLAGHHVIGFQKK